MIFYYDTVLPITKAARRFSNFRVYHRKDLPESCKFATTANLQHATYFLCCIYKTYVDLSAVYASYSTDPDDARCLYNLKLQYVPESLI